MKIPCPNISPVVTPNQCIPQCTRWTGINAGRPVRIYHDTSGWQQFYTQANSADPNEYFQPAVDYWNNAYSCGTLFELVATPQEADFIMRYTPEDVGAECEFIGQATCLCDPEDDPCSSAVDHSAFFSPANQGSMRLVFVECVRTQYSANQIINVIIHEFAHVLGFGHVYNTIDPLTNQLVLSVVGTHPTGGSTIEYFDYDLERLDLMHPCGCILTENSDIIQTPPQIFDSNVTCPGCRLQWYVH